MTRASCVLPLGQRCAIRGLKWDAIYSESVVIFSEDELRNFEIAVLAAISRYPEFVQA